VQHADSGLQAARRPQVRVSLPGPDLSAVAAGERCPDCDELIPPDALRRHLAGLDPGRLECPHQDLQAIKERERKSRSYFGAYWLLRRGDFA
jgi:hypothetical protein